MISILATGLNLLGVGPPPPPWPQPPGPVVSATPLVIVSIGTHDLGGSVRLLGRIPERVREYGRPALHVRADRVTVRGFSWRGSMEGVHAGSEPFTPEAMRRRHRPIRVTFDGLWCDDVGEDAIEIQPRARVVVRHSHIRGNHRRLRSEDPDIRGLDKLVQINGADVTFESCTFFNGVSCIRAKANSNVILRNCRFVDCSTCVSGDGLACPRPGNLYDNGQPGPCRITLINCEAWNCNLLARAYEGCEIHLIDCRLHRGGKPARENGGRIRVFRSERAATAQESKDKGILIGDRRENTEF